MCIRMFRMPTISMSTNGLQHRLVRSLTPMLLAAAAGSLLVGCAVTAPAETGFDCRALTGTYEGNSQGGAGLRRDLLGLETTNPTKAAPVRLTVGDGSLTIASGLQVDRLVAGKDYRCDGMNRFTLTRVESSRVHLPPLIDQTRTVRFAVTGGPGLPLTISTYEQTTVAPYGVKVKGPDHFDAATSWRRTAP